MADELTDEQLAERLGEISNLCGDDIDLVKEAIRRLRTPPEATQGDAPTLGPSPAEGRDLMPLVIVPDALRERLNAALDKALADAPPDAVKDREHLYSQLLGFFNEHGYIPDFSVGKPQAG